MTYDTYRMIFIVGLIASIALSVIAIILFFAFKIPAIIGYLTGSTEKKGVERIKKENQTTEKKSATTEKIVTAKNLKIVNNETVVLSQNSENETMVLAQGIKEGNETTILTNNLPEKNVTGKLAQIEDKEIKNNRENVIFKIVLDITYIHTDEIIDV